MGHNRVSASSAVGSFAQYLSHESFRLQSDSDKQFFCVILVYKEKVEMAGMTLVGARVDRAPGGVDALGIFAESETTLISQARVEARDNRRQENGTQGRTGSVIRREAGPDGKVPPCPPAD